MSSEPLLSSIIPFAGSGFAGFFMGMFLRRVLKFLVIIIGSFFGAVFLVIQWIQNVSMRYPSNWNKQEPLFMNWFSS
ncbi:MAG: hypothetical protein WBZ36_00605 [Candidatus Nitrosopolaris sp.]